MQSSVTSVFPRQRLIARLRSYYLVEGYNTLFFLLLAVYLNYKFGLRHSLLLTYGLGLMVFILAQGTGYWWLKLQVLRRNSANHIQALNRFRVFKKINVLLIALIPVIIGMQWLLSGRQFIPENHLGWALFANFFGILEHINYYHTQLMYDNRYDWRYLAVNKRLKPASLKKDLAENRL